MGPLPTFEEITAMNKRTCLPALSFVLFLCTSVKAQSSADKSADKMKREIRRQDSLAGVAFAKGDVDLFSGIYANDACVLVPNSPAICGADAGNQLFHYAYGAGIRTVNFNSKEI